MWMTEVHVDFNSIASVAVWSKPAWIAPLFCMLTLYLRYVGLYSFLVFCDCLLYLSIKIYLNTVLIQRQTLRRQEIQMLELNGVRCYTWCYTLVFYNAVSSVGPKYLHACARKRALKWHLL